MIFFSGERNMTHKAYNFFIANKQQMWGINFSSPYHFPLFSMIVIGLGKAHTYTKTKREKKAFLPGKPESEKNIDISVVIFLSPFLSSFSSIKRKLSFPPFYSSPVICTTARSTVLGSMSLYYIFFSTYQKEQKKPGGFGLLDALKKQE